MLLPLPSSAVQRPIPIIDHSKVKDQGKVMDHRKVKDQSKAMN